MNNKTRTPVAGRRPRARSSVNPPSDEFIDDSTTPTDNERAPGPPHAPDAPIQAQHELGSSAAAARSGHGREPLDPADIAAAQLRGVLDGLPDGVMLLDGVGRVTALNRIAAGLLGLAVEGLRDRLIQDIEWNLREPDGEPVPFHALPMTVTLREGTRVDAELVGGQGDNQRILQICTSSAVSERHGTLGVVVVLRDITDHRRIQQQLTRTETLRAVGQLASAAVHDINNLFGLILGQAELLLMADARPDTVDGLESIRQAAHDGAEALKRIQDIARAPNDAEPVTLDLNQILREVVDITRPRWSDQLQLSGAPIAVLLDLSLPPPSVVGQANELREIFTNLILNSVDAMPQGGTIRITSRTQRNRVTVTLADDGTGMTPDVKQRLFEPFFTTKGLRGSGLGMSITQAIVDRHHGRISLDSEPGRGTTFTLTFPSASRPVLAAEEENAPSAPRSKILVVEDEPEMRRLLVRLLQRDGHTVVACRTGREALVALESESFDLVLTDLVMSGVDGWAVATASREYQSDVPVGLISGTSEQFTHEQLQEHGVAARLTKPFTVNQLRRYVRSLVVERPSLRGAASRPRVLAVDDEPAMVRMLEKMLESSGCELATAASGAEALASLREAADAGSPYDMLFTDALMPGIDGPSLISAARGYDPHLVTVLISGQTRSESEEQGADLVLQKPFTLADLLKTLDQGRLILEQRRGSLQPSKQ